jgi:phospholipid/cholesterol/gamma-HCH transport system substrate-binding protein
MNKFYVQLTAGIFVLIGGLCLAWLSIRLGGLETWGEGYQVEARFSDVGGLREGAAVSIAGVQVGSVSQVKLDDYAALVTLRMDPNVKLPEGTIASIRTSGLIGEQFIYISPGGGEENIQPGERIEETQPAVDLHSLISKYAFGDVDSDL